MESDPKTDRGAHRGGSDGGKMQTHVCAPHPTTYRACVLLGGRVWMGCGGWCWPFCGENQLIWNVQRWDLGGFGLNGPPRPGLIV